MRGDSVTPSDRSFIRSLNRALAVEWIQPSSLDWAFYGLRYDTGELVDPVEGSVRPPMEHKDVWSGRSLRDPLPDNPFPISA